MENLIGDRGDLPAIFPEQGHNVIGRIRRCLHNHGYRTRAKLARTPDVEFLQIRDFGDRCLQILRERVPFEATEPICGVISHSGPNREPLACGYLTGHTGNHSWATLPTFIPGNLEHAEIAGDVLPVAYSAEVEELIHGAIESTDNTPRTARLRKALEAFGVE